jgi:hypothetical protein
MLDQQGPEVFLEQVNGGEELLEYKLSAIGSKHDMQTVTGRSRAVQELCALLTNVDGLDVVKQNFLVQKVAAYFRVPEGAPGKRIHFENATRLFDPDGKPFRGGERLSGWVDLPDSRGGLWSFASMEPGLVKTENLPGFFAMGGPELYMECGMKTGD